MAFSLSDTTTAIGDWFSDIGKNITSYAKSLTEYQKYAWASVGLGFVLVIIAIILW
jgi:hypothetical protein